MAKTLSRPRHTSGLAVCDGVAVPVRVTKALGVGARVKDADGVPVMDDEPKELSAGVAVRLAIAEWVSDADGVPVCEPIPLRLLVALELGVPVGVMRRLVYSDGRGDTTIHVHIPAGPTSAQL
jgi:hypothetical protein